MTTEKHSSDDQFLQLSKSIIDDFSGLRKVAIVNQTSQTDFIGKFVSLRANFHSKKKEHFSKFINSFPSIITADRIKNKEVSCDFNILQMFAINEVQHSYLLGEFLNPNGKHGQGDLFLSEFLDLIGIEGFPNQERWFVAVERGNIHILLKRVKPVHSVVVIENKSNYAIDQPNQLYRYWHQELYTKIVNKNMPSDYISKPAEKN